MTKPLGKKNRMKLFEINFTLLQRILAVTDESKSGVFQIKSPFENRDSETVSLVKNSFEIWRQEDISALKTLLYHLDPCDEKTNYKTKVESVCTWADPIKRLNGFY